MLARDLFYVDGVLLRRLGVLSFIELDTRRVSVRAATAKPAGERVTHPSWQSERRSGPSEEGRSRRAPDP